MAVVINEFEIVPETESPPGEAPLPAPPTAPRPSGPSPDDVRQIIHVRRQRAERLFAH